MRRIYRMCLDATTGALQRRNTSGAEFTKTPEPGAPYLAVLWPDVGAGEAEAIERGDPKTASRSREIIKYAPTLFPVTPGLDFSDLGAALCR